MVIGVIAQRGNDRAVSLAERVRARIDRHEVRVDAETAASLGVEGIPPEALGETDLVVSIGGDGTFLFAARRLRETPIMGVNLGEVGFLTAVSPTDAVEAVQAASRALDGGDLHVRQVSRITARGPEWSLDPALNEVMVHAPQRGAGHRIEAVVRIDGEAYDRSRVDGVMIATPTGSTAYNLSERGPLVAPGVPALVVNQMCANHARPPLVAPLAAVIEVELRDATHASVVGDGRDRQRLEVPTTVSIAAAEQPLHVAGPPVDFYGALDRLS